MSNLAPSEVSPNIYGIETEYSFMVTLPGNIEREIVGGCHSADNVLGLYEAPKQNGLEFLTNKTQLTRLALRQMGIYSNQAGMLSNGGRLYNDLSGPEYCTPEATSAEEAVYRTFDGDKILFNIFRQWQEKKLIDGFQINRRIVDHNRSSRGVHLNTLTSMPLFDFQCKPVINQLAVLNVAKGAIFGSGGLLVDEEGNTSFHHSPRLSVTNCLASEGGSFDRPLVRRPVSTECGDQDIVRLETVTSDALNFGWPLKASLVVTNAVVGLMELYRTEGLPEFLQGTAIESAHNVGQNGSEGVMHILDQNGRNEKALAIDVLRGISESVLTVNEQEGYLDKESVQVMNEVIEVADKIRKDPLSVIGQVESVARKATFDRAMEKRKVTLDSERICRLDYAWDKIGGGLAEIHREKGKFGWQGFAPRPTPSASKRRLVTAPTDTRAHIRGAMIAANYSSDRSRWDQIDFGDGIQEPMHPLATTIPADVTLTKDLANNLHVKQLG